MYARLVLVLVIVHVSCTWALHPKAAKTALRHLKWSHSVWLGETGTSPRFYWTANKDYVDFSIEANTIGSIHLELDRKDLVVLWVEDATGKARVEDYHYVNVTVPVLDLDSNYDIIAADQNQTHTTLAIRRRWNTCDSNDVVLGPDTVRVVWSIHPHDGDEDDQPEVVQPGGAAWSLEGTLHGEKSLLLQEPLEVELPASSAVHKWDVLMRNVLIRDDMSTQYWCKVFRSPSLPKKNHIIAYDPLILSSSSSLVHHMILYECDAPPGYLDSYASYNHNGARCYSPEMPDDWENCVTPIATWVLGGKGKVLPEHVGLPLGPRQTYFMLEVHYDNPGLRKLFDNSGFSLYHTDEVRTYDGGVLRSGVTVTSLHFIPPLQPKYHSTGLCNDICTNKMFPEMGIRVLSVLLHSHMAGRAMRLRHIRGDKELPRIVEDNQYDSSYQTDRHLKEEVTVFPGDQLITECEYFTADRNMPTFGGYSSREEMCLSYITYYPRTQLASCNSMAPVRHFLNALGIKSFYNVTMEQLQRYVLRTGPPPLFKKTASTTTAATTAADTDDAAIAKLQTLAGFVVEEVEDDNNLLKLVINEPLEFRDRDLAGHLAVLPWNDSTFTESFEQSLARGFKMVFCRQRNDQLALPLNIESFPKFSEFEEAEVQDCRVSGFLERSGATSSHASTILPTLLLGLSVLATSYRVTTWTICF